MGRQRGAVRGSARGREVPVVTVRVRDPNNVRDPPMLGSSRAAALPEEGISGSNSRSSLRVRTEETSSCTANIAAFQPMGLQRSFPAVK